MSANLQIFTLRKGLLTALSSRARDNESHGREDEAQHLALLQPICADVVVHYDPYGDPPSITNCLSVSNRQISYCLSAN